MRIYIGIDGGGTKTRSVAVTEQGTILADLTTPGSNVNHHGWAGVEESLFVLFNLLRTHVPLGAQVASLCLGFAGIDRESDRVRMEEWAATHWPTANVRVVHDARIALEAGLPVDAELGVGIVLIAGTGSVAYGRNEAGEETRVGGWGYLLGDEGSGYDLGRRAITSVLRAYDGRDPQTALTELVLNAYGVQEPTDLLPLVYGETSSRGHVAQSARLVFDAATAGDLVAQALVEGAADELAALVVALLQKMNVTARRLTVVLAGGLFSTGSPLIGLFEARLPDTVDVRPGQPPVFGALRLAQEGR
ncbi:N-acetylglucosamine kinase [Tumebacillus sp. ITR2]|uniref:N-acetylglucosamine kinase n=1 Tax=Tumebacillus amylolyticus TaxID=2801339 RepID=A0ABS1JEA0_9BACL|nr:BadF/BadG/BcrA/BcrD ATPase family protein [Tumebacillus amylolyticus]MBL0388616.1 N-acetylglucosamine kinase [Tumebacillus amylolyticus]